MLSKGALEMTVKQSLALRIGLDCVLIAICATLFSKNVISLMYHEVVGLVLLILFQIFPQVFYTCPNREQFLRFPTLLQTAGKRQLYQLYLPASCFSFFYVLSDCHETSFFLSFFIPSTAHLKNGILEITAFKAYATTKPAIKLII